MRREDRSLVGRLGILHGTVHANLLAVPVLLNISWRPEFGLDDVAIGVLAAILYACFGLSSVPFGFLADRRTPGPLLALCAVGIAVSLSAVAMAPSAAFLAVSLAGLGLASGIHHPTALAAISRAVEEQGRGMGWHGMGGSLGIALGPAVVGAVLALGWSWRWAVGLLVAPPILAAVLLAATRVPASARNPSPHARLLPRGLLTAPYARMLLVYLFAGFAYQGSLTFLPGFVGPGPFALALAVGAVGQVLAGTLADRSRPDRILFVLSLAAGLLLAVLAGLGASGAFTIVAVGFGFLLFSLESLQNTLVTRTVPRSIRGFGFGLTFLSVFGLGSIGAGLAGWLIARNQADLLFVLLGASIALSGGIAWGVGALRPSS